MALIYSQTRRYMIDNITRLDFFNVFTLIYGEFIINLVKHSKDIKIIWTFITFEKIISIQSKSVFDRFQQNAK